MLIRKLIWDEWNIDHIARHGVEPEEVERVCKGKHLARRGREGTYTVTGQTQAGRYLTIILAPRGVGSFYPITARDSDDKERRLFKKK